MQLEIIIVVVRYINTSPFHHSLSMKLILVRFLSAILCCYGIYKFQNILEGRNISQCARQVSWQREAVNNTQSSKFCQSFKENVIAQFELGEVVTKHNVQETLAMH